MNKEQTYQELTEQEKQLIQMILIEFSDILPPEVYDFPLTQDEQIIKVGERKTPLADFSILGKFVRHSY